MNSYKEYLISIPVNQKIFDLIHTGTQQDQDDNYEYFRVKLHVGGVEFRLVSDDQYREFLTKIVNDDSSSKEERKSAARLLKF